MTNQKMLIELIKLAKKNGCLSIADKSTLEAVIDWSSTIDESWYGRNVISIILFQHNFAKAIFGESPACGNPNCDICPGIWTHRLSDLALTLEVDRIKYAWENRKK